MNKNMVLPWLFVTFVCWALLSGGHASRAATAETAACGPNCVRVEVVAPPSKAGPDAPKPFDWKWLATTLVSLAAAAVALRTAYGQRRTSTDGKIHEERIRQYQAIITDTAPLAVYFPAPDSEGKSRLTADDCMKMGRAANEWYFAHGAMLMSVEARNAYMRFARGLTFASQADKPLMVPEYPHDSILVTDNRLDDYRASLLMETDSTSAAAAVREPGLSLLRKMWTTMLDRPDRGGTAAARAGFALASDAVIAKWQFGIAAGEDAPPHQRFRDYVFLQNLSSKLRTALAQDLRSRRRPE